MICGRCQRQIQVSESDSLLTFTNLVRMNPKTDHLCERCSLGFIEWFAKGNYIQKQIAKEENENV